MLCRNPYLVDGKVPFGCGQCLPCRINRSRLWVHRLLLESHAHTFSTFVTLTYSPENVPEDGSLRPLDTQLWLKRLRDAIKPRRIRFYLVGEYGDKNFRPHYHVMLFGISTDEYELIYKTWGLGNVMLGTVESASCQYIAGYVTKKMTSADDDRLQGRYPEFCRMSNRPGIGCGGDSTIIDQLSDFLTTDVGSKECADLQDIPRVLRHGKKIYPLGRYLRRRLREKIAWPELGKNSPTYKAYEAEVSHLFEDAKVFSDFERKCFLVKESYGKIVRLEHKVKFFKKKESL